MLPKYLVLFMVIEILEVGRCAVDRVGCALGLLWKSEASLSASTFSLASGESSEYLIVLSWWLLIHTGVIGRLNSL